MTSDAIRAVIAQIRAIERLIRSGITSDEIVPIGNALHDALLAATESYRPASDREHERVGEMLDDYHRAASCDVSFSEIFEDWGGAA